MKYVLIVAGPAGAGGAIIDVSDKRWTNPDRPRTETQG